MADHVPFHERYDYASSDTLLCLGMRDNRHADAYYVPPSAYGGAGGHRVLISNYNTPIHAYNAPIQAKKLLRNLKSPHLLVDDKKMTMKHLNDRLASYMEKVQALEEKNSKLENQIKEHCGENTFTLEPDYSIHKHTITELKDKIRDASKSKVKLMQQLDSAGLAAYDYDIRFDKEHCHRRNVELDVGMLRKVRDDLTLETTELESHIEHKQEDLAIMEKTRDEELEILKKKLGRPVKVEVDAAPAVDLAEIMDAMRMKYDKLVAKNRQGAKVRFEKEIKALKTGNTMSTKELNAKRVELEDLKRKMQGLEIELESLLMSKQERRHILEGIKARYRSQIDLIKLEISPIELQLRQKRDAMKRQHQDNTKLGAEIAEYRRLLEVNWVHSSRESSSSENRFTDSMPEKLAPSLKKLQLQEEARVSEASKTQKVTTIIEEVVDGKVVSKKVQTVERK